MLNTAVPAAEGLGKLIVGALRSERLTLTGEDRDRMARGVRDLDRWVASGRDAYGVTRGFGPLVRYPAAGDGHEQGLNLIHHLCAGQGRPLGVAASRLLVWLRLQGMRLGHSAVAPETWEALADLVRRGLVPVVPGEGSVSASGDLIPLAHAAQAFAGQGLAWWRGRPTAAAEVIGRLECRPLRWPGRAALAFVNGCGASLAVTMLNHAELAGQARACAALTARIVGLLGCSREPYAKPVHRVRGHPGQLRAARWIEGELTGSPRTAASRPLQEPYSLRCAPQVVGAVLDQLALQEQPLLREATGCTDNPVTIDGAVWHGGNFHAAPGGLASDLLSLCAHQLAYLAERQLALVLDPGHNGGQSPLLAADPGRNSGFAGVQIAASGMVAKIRQLAHPATLTALPTNLGNQDHVPMALNGAVAGTEIVRLGWLVIGSLAVAVAQLARLLDATPPPGSGWHRLQDRVAPLDRDRPLAEDVRAAAGIVRRCWGGEVLSLVPGDLDPDPTDAE
ncbi:aromatic amino acid ammonia-lyase [Micromonospora matsumotoense]|uniref:aromatic amino acid ammonia-lyase n=1 Tax=Micromonospora matsumotoense TaxID=121616 RepID=UPI0033C2650E